MAIKLSMMFCFGFGFGTWVGSGEVMPGLFAFTVALCGAAAAFVLFGRTA